MPEGRHIDCPVSPQVRLSNTIGVHEDCTLARFQDTATAYYYVVAGAVSTRLLTSRTWKTMNGKPLSSSQIVHGPDAETSSGRL